MTKKVEKTLKQSFIAGILIMIILAVIGAVLNMVGLTAVMSLDADTLTAITTGNILMNIVLLVVGILIVGYVAIEGVKISKTM